MAPEDLAREEAELRTQREEGAKQALKVKVYAHGCTASHLHADCIAPYASAGTFRLVSCLQEALNPQEGEPLDDDRYQELDKLLSKTGMYTQFLSEQLQALDDQMSAEPEAAVGQKRKAGNPGARTRKRGAAAKTTAGSKKVGAGVQCFGIVSLQSLQAQDVPGRNACHCLALHLIWDMVCRPYESNESIASVQYAEKSKKRAKLLGGMCRSSRIWFPSSRETCARTSSRASSG